MKEEPPNSPKDQNTRDQMKKIGDAVDELLPSGWGFFVMAFPYEGFTGRGNYISKGRREDVLKVMQEFIERNKQFGTHD